MAVFLKRFDSVLDYYDQTMNLPVLTFLLFSGKWKPKGVVLANSFSRIQ